MKKFSVFILLLFNGLVVLAQQNSWFTIKAFLPQWNGAEVSLFDNEQLLYAGAVTKDMFVYTGGIDLPTQGSLKIKSGKNVFYVPMFLEPGTIKVRDAGNKTLVSYGTFNNDQYLRVNATIDSLAMQQKNSSFSEAKQYKRVLATNFIKDHPSSVVSVQLLKDYYYLAHDANDTLYYFLVHSLDSSLQKLFYAKEMMKEACARYTTAVNKPAPVLEVNDTSGRATALYNVGEYTLINFWASWCAPCRRENLALLNLYRKYSSLGFNITGVSLDMHKVLWINAIKHDKLSWKQLNDFGGWNSSAVEAYGIKAIPMTFLINREGIIIAKNLYAEQLDKLLGTLLNQNNSRPF